MNRIVFCLLLVLNSHFQFSQNANSFSWPLDTPCVLTANYGELRPNHFHAGIDISTYGLINIPVKSAEDGYVSRIKTSAYGYGRCVYITHPNKLVTVYAHLNSYSAKIDSVIKNEQVKNKSYEAELYLDKNKIKIKRAEVIGLSGNSGGSTGPHLHFEIRDEISEIPYNALNYFKVKDNTPPVVQSVALFDLSDTLNPKFIQNIKVKQNSLGHFVTENENIQTRSSIIGIAFSGYDKFSKDGSTNNIYSAQLEVDSKKIYAHQLNGIHFDDSRYVNQFSETEHGFKYQNCFMSEYVPKDFNYQGSHRGIVVLKDKDWHTIKLIVQDEAKNSCEVLFKIKTEHQTLFSSSKINSDAFINCRKNFYYKKNNLSLTMAANTLFNSSALILENTLETSGKLMVLPSDVNLKIAATLKFIIPKKFIENKQKLILQNHGAVVLPIIKGDSAICAIKNFGWFQLDEDVSAPIIKPIQSKKRRRKQSPSIISFAVKDKLSGIGKFYMYVNNTWVLSEYDAKNNLISYSFKSSDPKGYFKIKLVVEDKVGNANSCEVSLKR